MLRSKVLGVFGGLFLRRRLRFLMAGIGFFRNNGKLLMLIVRSDLRELTSVIPVPYKPWDHFVAFMTGHWGCVKLWDGRGLLFRVRL